MNAVLPARLEHRHSEATNKSFAEVRIQLNESLRWLQALGVDLPTGNRFEVYEGLLAELERHYEDETWLADKIRSDRAINALYEISELISLRQAFAMEVPAGLVQKLSEYVQGPEEVSGEELTPGGIAARNTGFELHAAARFLRGGYVVALDRRADVLVDLGNARGLVECKRVRRGKKVRPNIQNARQQALSDTGGRSADETACVLALDVSFVLNPGNILLRATKPLSEALMEISNKIALSVGVDMQGLWHQRVLGIMVRFSCIAASDGIPHHVEWWVFMRNGQLNAQRQALSDSMAQRLGSR